MEVSYDILGLYFPTPMKIEKRATYKDGKSNNIRGKKKEVSVNIMFKHQMLDLL